MYNICALHDAQTGEEFLFVAKRIWYEEDDERMFFLDVDDRLLYLSGIALDTSIDIVNKCFAGGGLVATEYGVMTLFDKKKAEMAALMEMLKDTNPEMYERMCRRANRDTTV